jgi:hypothetical protein
MQALRFPACMLTVASVWQVHFPRIRGELLAMWKIVFLATALSLLAFNCETTGKAQGTNQDRPGGEPSPAPLREFPDRQDDLDRQVRRVMADMLDSTERELSEVIAELAKLKDSRSDSAQVGGQRRFLEDQKALLEKGRQRLRANLDKTAAGPPEKGKEPGRPPFEFSAGLAAGALVFGDVPGAPKKLFKFKKSEVRGLPAGWKAAHTGTGAGSVWMVLPDPSAPSNSGLVLAQTAASPSKYFNLCVADEPSAKDLELQVAFKAVKGKEDQGGGLVWRYQDADNYYVARMNPLETNFRVYKVIAGKRIQLGSKEGVQAPVGRWHTISIKQVGDKIECSFDGQLYLEATDKAITEAGKVGLWTKADAQSYFDDLQLTPLDP